ncbi:hypothetical protein LCGC14_2304420, partial [marine sediment metagenome]
MSFRKSSHFQDPMEATGSYTGTFVGSGTSLTGVVSSSHALDSDSAITASHADSIDSITPTQVLPGDFVGDYNYSGSLGITGDIDVDGSVTASAFQGDGSQITGVISASHALNADNSVAAISSSHALDADNAVTASHADSIDSVTPTQVLPGDFEGAYNFSGSVVVSGNIEAINDITASALQGDGAGITGVISASHALNADNAITASHANSIDSVVPTQVLPGDFVGDYNISGSFGVTGGVSGSEFSGSGEDLRLAHLDGATFQTLQHLQNTFHSAGTIGGGVITDAGGETIDVSAAQIGIRVSDSGIAQLLFVDIAATASVAIPFDATRFIIADYNAGSPIVRLNPTDDSNNNTSFQLGNVINESGTLHIQSIGHKVGDHAGQMVSRLEDTSRFARDELTGGLILGETGDRGRDSIRKFDSVGSPNNVSGGKLGTIFKEYEYTK